MRGARDRDAANN